MKRKTLCIIGHFGFGMELLNGQTIKTKIIANELEKQLGIDEIVKIDTYNGKRKIIKLFFQVKRAMKYCRNVAILPATNGLFFFAPLLCFLKKIYKTKIDYIVIGGWLVDFLKKQKYMQKILKKFNGIYVETFTMKEQLEKMGFSNIYIMPNCKQLNILQNEELVFSNVEPLKLCTFSRVMKEKGIEEAIEAVKSVNQKLNRKAFILDIYGQIDVNQKKWFENLQNNFPSYIKYKGEISFFDSTKVLKTYYAVLFPTYYKGEGFAGTIIDAMAAGVPVIASDWKYNAEIIENNITGIIVRKNESIEEKLLWILNNKEQWSQMKERVLIEAHKYLASNVLNLYISNLE